MRAECSSGISQPDDLTLSNNYERPINCKKSMLSLVLSLPRGSINVRTKKFNH
jgi:hypothetical protein